MKNLKKTYRFIIILLAIVITFPALGYVVLQSKKVQNTIIHKITNELSEKLKARISIETASVNLFNRVKLNNVYIEDLNRDTLFFAKEVTIGLRRYNQKKRILQLSNLEIEESKFLFRIDSTQTVNLQFIIDEFKNNKSGKKQKDRLKFSIRNIDIRESVFSLTNARPNNKSSGIDFTDMWLDPFELEVDGFELRHDTALFEIEGMHFKEKSGFAVKNFVSRLSISKRHMHYQDMTIHTAGSELATKEALFEFSKYNNFKIRHIYDSVRLNIACNPSRLAMTDLAFFADIIPPVKENIILSGVFKGKLNNLKGKNLNIRYNSGTSLNGSFDIKGLPDISNTFVFFDITQLITSTFDIQKIYREFYDPEYQITELFDSLEVIKYTGKFTGFFDDFVTYGKFNTALGNLSTDLLLRPAGKKTIEYSGNLITENFELGRLLSIDNKIVDRISGDININGKSSAEDRIDADIEGTIYNLEINQYPYKNINISGRLLSNFFDGEFKVRDPNLNLDFAGRVDFTDELADFDFTARVSQANLFNLNIDKSDSSSVTSFMLQADGSGKNLDQLNGEFRLMDAFFSKKENQIEFSDLGLTAMNAPDSSYLSLRSDIVDAELFGNYEIQMLPNTIKTFLNFYLPSLFPEVNIRDDIERNSFSFHANLKDTKEFSAFFFPNFTMAENTHVEGNFIPKDSTVRLHLKSNNLVYKHYSLENFFINVFTSESGLSLESGSKFFNLNKNIHLENYALKLHALNDTINFNTQWHNWDTTVYKGNINALMALQKLNNHKLPSIDVMIPPSEVIMHDSVWQIARSTLEIDSSRIFINNFNIKRNQQEFNINGLLSADANDRLVFSFRDFSLENLNMLIENNKVSSKGLMNGECEIFNVYDNFSFNSDLDIKDLYVNGEIIGDSKIKAFYNSDQKLINVEADAMRGDINTIAIAGDYTPADKAVDFDMTLNKLRLNTFNPYLRGVFSNLKGMASGNIDVKGTLDRPLTNGKIKLNKSSVEVNYLKTKYTFSDQVKIKDNTIYFDDINIFDQRGNAAVANGIISNKYLKNFELDMHFKADHFLFLNTTYADNNDFYGTAFASGMIDISGPTKNLVFNIKATTDPETRFYIPLSSSEEVEEFNFVRFKKPATKTDQSENTVEEDEYKVNLSSLVLNFELDVTPEAEVQIIFDSKMGDIIRGRGDGNLRMAINTLGKFNMYGDYSITEGDYLFTLKNLINKKFQIVEGSYISWNGNPMDADLNIKASYETKSTLTNLFPTEAENKEDPNSSIYNKRLPVECQLLLTEQLVNPKIDFGIYLPTADPFVRSQVEGKINTEEELSKHFLSLLVINNFMIDPNQIPSAGDNTALGNGINPIGVTTSELFSNQVSHWLSQMSNDFDIGVNYRPGDELTKKELEVALSTKILNDRVSINGNLDVGGKPTRADINQTNNIVGDFNVDFKLNRNVHLKAFNKANNDNYRFYDSDYTQGVGIFYREEFDTFDELFIKYLAKLGLKEKYEQKN